MPKSELASLLLGGPGHDGYAYNADVLCVDCGQKTIVDLYKDGAYDDGDPGDSDAAPQPIFFGESDCAQHCSVCGEYLYGLGLEVDDAD